MSTRNALAIAIALLVLGSCTLVRKTLQTGGEQKLAKGPPPPPAKRGPHLIIFAMDGAVPAQLMDAIHSGKAPHIAAALGRDRGNGLFEHAYAAPHALSILPSSTIADWAAIFTGSVPAWDGVPGDEWFVRDTGRFYAPVPVSVTDLTDNTKVVTDDLVGKAIKVPTLYELLGVESNVSMLSVHRGATYYTTVAPTAIADMVEHLIKGTLQGHDPKRSLSGSIDRDSVAKLIDAIEEHGVPDLQVVYFPGIDIFTHAAEDPLASQEGYLELVTDPAVGEVLGEYQKKGELDKTYFIFISDHAHIPTVNDEAHTLGTDDENSPFAAVARAHFRVRKASILLPDADKDYQAVLAYQGFMAYIYLADRSTCPHDGDVCDWKKPPRFEEDVVPVLKVLYRSNTLGRPIRKLKGTIDLIFARQPVRADQDALPFEVFDGHLLVPIDDYLRKHPRPDLIDLEERMRWLGAGRYGNRAGDIVLLAKACTDLPISQRYAFAGITHYSWHGSACEQDSHIPFILGQYGGSGERMRSMMEKFGGASPSERELTPLVRSLFGK
jgi:Type I phosphodiesterase / nucleotide pyrophosphatase